MVVKDEEGLFTSSHLPFSLLPYTLPPESFDQARNWMPLFNILVDRVSRDGPWLEEVLGDILARPEFQAGDPFTAELMRIHNVIEAEGGARQSVCLGINRSDYMLHAPDEDGGVPHLLQVELNTIASSFGCMSALTARMQRHLLGRFADQSSALGLAVREHMEANGIKETPAAGLARLVPENPTLTALPAAIGAAHSHYGKKEAVVVFVVQPGEANAVDQRLLEFGLWDDHGVRVMRMSLAQIEERSALQEDGRLIVDGGVEVSVVYFRAGYTPDDYPTRKEWDARLKVERSMAIKCPSITYHLAGTKKVQQVLAEEGQVERFLSPEDSATLRRCFAGLYALGNSGATEAKATALSRPSDFVLKPQREGGGNNLYGAELATKLSSTADEELQSFVLMQRIFPSTQRGILVNRGRTVVGPSISELGIYGTYLGGGEGVGPLLNEYAGFLVRTKLDGVDEGGVASGYAVLSSLVVERE
ncbi:unnamed protein product [Discosporangium mesarthrocarpum]